MAAGSNSLRTALLLGGGGSRGAVGVGLYKALVELNYAGKPDGQRFPTFFSLDTKIYRDFHLPLPGVNESSRRKVRLGLYSINLTNHKNYNDVFRNITSPFFGQFAGFEHRINGFVLEIVE